MAKTNKDVRINKYLADAGQGSRRAVEQLVRNHRVQVDGETVTDLSTRISADQSVRVDGKLVRPARRTVVFALNKPTRVLVSRRDPDGRALAIDLVKPRYSGRLFSVGRLDYLSSGLLLFTNDGDLAQALMRPATGVEREYVVETSGPISDDVLTQLQSGVSVEGVTYRISRFHRHAARRVSMILTEGKNREIRKMFAEFGIKVARIYRTRYGPIRLAGLPEGETRQLSDNEVDRLQRSTQVSRSAVQGGDAS